ncbi:MAG: hypothetical protein JNM47_09820 [Hyphomonadaceae bacterium]|nr:hypothetical protein [Hyphomonadaceae bacterium]
MAKKRKSAQAALSAKAFELKQANAKPPAHPATVPHADEGIVSNPHAAQAPSGAFDAEGQRPVLERSRKVR